jgi:hypothetical protein
MSKYYCSISYGASGAGGPYVSYGTTGITGINFYKLLKAKLF